jgi:hypothetical protein
VTVQPIQRPEPQDRRRPAKQAERVQARKQKAMDAEAVGIRIDGVEYVINPNDITGSVERKIRQTIGKGIPELQIDLKERPGIDLLGEFMWAVRFANGERDLGLDEVLDSVSYGSDVEIMVDAGEAAPKA